jgi:2-methylcitrate dehydratase
MMNVVEDMAGWVAELRYEHLPPEIVEKSKRILLDTLGCALGAVHAEPVSMAQKVVSMQGGNAQATAVGVGVKAPCDQAAFLNGMALRYLDFNDYAASGSPHHPSINVAPALAVAEMQGLTGKDLLLGITVGYEVQLRLRDATARGSKEGWDHSTTTHYSSAALAGKLLGLDAHRIAQALAIAGSHASTLAEVRHGALSMWKGAAEPMGARNGTFAALLARSGLTGPLTILEGKYGYGKVVAGALEEKILRERSGEFQILKSCIKVWPCVVTAQAPIAAALEIRRQKVNPEEIETITVTLSEFGFKQQQRFPKEEITTRETADHSVAYTVARAFLDGHVTADHFEVKSFHDPRALALVKKVSFRSDPFLTSLYPESIGANVEVQLQNGNLLKAEAPYPPGHRLNPADDESLVKKFLALSENVLGKERAQRATEVILCVEALSDLGSLVELLSPSEPG